MNESIKDFEESVENFNEALEEFKKQALTLIKGSNEASQILVNEMKNISNLWKDIEFTVNKSRRKEDSLNQEIKDKVNI